MFKFIKWIGIFFLLAGLGFGLFWTYKKAKQPVQLSLKEKQQFFLGLAQRILVSPQDVASGLESQLAYLKRKPPEKVVLTLPKTKVCYQDLADTVLSLKLNLHLLVNDPQSLAEIFDVYRLSAKVLLTGYYEPWLEASKTRDNEYKYPVYKKPPDLKVAFLERFHPRFKGMKLYYRIAGDKIVPYYSRKQIDLGALAHKGLELAWVKDKIKLFFLHVQGSGRLVFRDGTVKHVLYAGKNGLRYVSLGKVLVKRGFLSKDQVTMQSIYNFLFTHPKLTDQLLWTNPSYVFFRLADQGPFGCTGQVLTPWLSVASDNKFVPWGSVLVGEGNLPLGSGDKEFTSLWLVQDTGGAIKGEHLDLFCGSGKLAEEVAGKLKNQVKVYLLLRKNE